MQDFLPVDWDKDTLQKIPAARMSLNQSFYNFFTDIVTSNSLLVSGTLYLTEDSLKEQIFNNMTEDLPEKLKESAAELAAALNALSFQKWLNTISKTDV